MTGRWRTVLWVVTAAAIAAALLVAALATPEAIGLGGAIRILYVHVGSAWTAYLAYAVTAIAAVAYLVKRDRRMDWVAVASAEWGLVLTTLTLVTGSLWGRPTQGWWWRWDDARLTLTLMLWFIYAAYLILRQYTSGDRQATLSAIVAMAGVPAMVLNHFATVLFPAMHPPPVAVRPGGPAMDEIYQMGLALSVVAFTLIYVTVLVERIRLEAVRGRLDDTPAREGHDGWGAQ